MKRIRYRIHFAALTIIAMVLVACGGESTAPEPEPTPEPEPAEEPSDEGDGEFAIGDLEVDTLTSPMFAATSWMSGVWAAQHEGLWDQYGLSVEVPLLESTQQVAAYLAGELPIVVSGTYLIEPSVRGGVPISIYSWVGDKSNYRVYGTPDIQSLEDLRGKNIGVSGLGGLPHVTMAVVLEEFGIDESEITWQPLGGVPALYNGVLTGQVDAGAFGAPFSVMAEQEGLTMVYDVLGEGLPFPSVVIVGNPEWVEAHPNTAKAFIAGFLEGMWIFYSDADRAKEILQEELDIEGDILEATYADFLGASRAPSAESGDTSPELFATMLMTDELAGRDPDIVAAAEDDILRPASNIVAELAADGFFEMLEDRYGPLPAS